MQKNVLNVSHEGLWHITIYREGSVRKSGWFYLKARYDKFDAVIICMHADTRAFVFIPNVT